jgi:glycosyltransferase involved in cell wall biosynthesis
MMDVSFIGGRGLYSNYGGVENAIREITKELTKKRLNVSVYGVASEAESVFPNCNRITPINMAQLIYRIGGQHFYILSCVLHAGLILRPKVVFLFASGPCVFTPVLRLFGIKVVTSLRAVDSKRDKWGHFSRNILKLGEYFSWRFSNVFTVNSLTMQRHFKPYRNDVIFIPNGTKTMDIDSEEVLRSLNLRENEYYLFAARLDPVKRLHLLLSVYKQLPAALQFPLIVAGGNVKDEKYLKRLKKLANENVKFIGHVNEKTLEPLMSACRAFILPSILEGMSNSLLSAMANKRAVLVANVDENRDVVENNKACFIADDEVDMLKKLTLLSSSNSHCEQLGSEMLRIIQQKYSWSNTAYLFYQQYIKLRKL